MYGSFHFFVEAVEKNALGINKRVLRVVKGFGFMKKLGLTSFGRRAG